MANGNGQQQAANGQSAVETFGDFFRTRKKALSDVAPQTVSVDKIMKVAMAAYSRTPDLWACTPDSIYQAIHQATALGLEIGGQQGHAYIVPFNNTKVTPARKEGQLIIGYRGLIELLYRAGEIESIDAEVVYEGDRFEDVKGLNPVFVYQKLLKGDRGKAIAVFDLVRFKSGRCVTHTMTEADVMARKAASKQQTSDLWVKWPDEARKKTCLRNHSKWLKMRTEDADKLEAIEGNVGAFDPSGVFATEGSGEDADPNAPALPDPSQSGAIPTGTQQRTDDAKAAMRSGKKGDGDRQPGDKV